MSQFPEEVETDGAAAAAQAVPLLGTEEQQRFAAVVLLGWQEVLLTGSLSAAAIKRSS